MKGRLRDIAEHAGVSEATVSRVLNGKPGVAEETRRAVLAVIHQLDYDRPVPRNPRSGLVGLMVPELENPVFPALAQAIEEVFAQQGFTAVLCSCTPSGTQEIDYIDMLLDRGVAGILFISGVHADTQADHGRYRDLSAAGMPMVFINGFAEGVDAAFYSNDDDIAMELGIRHLIAMGHRTIGCAVGPARYVPSSRKAATFLRIAAEASEDQLAERLVHSVYTVEGGYAAAQRLLDLGCTGIVCGSDLMALGAVRAVRRRGLQVPADVSVIGFDDSPLIAFTDPPLTTLRQPVQAMGVAAARSLLDEIAGVQRHRGEFLFRPELVVRSSTGPRRSQVPGVTTRGDGGPVPRSAHPNVRPR